MAWEMVITYRDFLLAKKKGQISGPLPHMSLISSGSAAIAVQSMLKKYGLPRLKVLVDINMKPFILAALKKTGCEVFQTDLSKKAFTWSEILSLTNNRGGFDITSSEALNHSTRFYDWMSYEILNNSPEYCFVPFGSGMLYENILNVNKREISTKNRDPRFTGNLATLGRCNFLGATTNNPQSKAAEKLYSPHLPFVHFDEQWISLYRYAGFCGQESNVYLLDENSLDEALELAQEQNINCEPSGIAGLALLLQLKDKIPKNKKILVVNTGKTKY